MRQRGAAESFNSAIEGFLYVMKTQKNMKFHFLAAVAILIAAIYLHVPMSHILILCCAISLVLITEMINTAMEQTINMFTETFHPLARIIKDVAAGSVLIAAVNAFIVGYMIFQRRLGVDLNVGLLRIRQSPWHMTFIAVIIVMAVVVAAKIMFHKGTPMRGGMPSGHAAFVFSTWTVILFLSRNPLVIILSLIMAVLICRSRVVERIHTPWEVTAGAVLGGLITALVFQFLKQSGYGYLYN